MADRYWLLTWTTYGTWLPSDERGFVSNIDSGNGTGVRKNVPGTEFSAKLRGLQSFALKKLEGSRIFLNQKHAAPLLEQFQETATYRKWELISVAIMPNHLHLIVGVPNDPDPAEVLQAMKSYGSRKLNTLFQRPASGTWWTESGSRRKLATEEALIAGCRYLRNQTSPLLIWERI